MSRIRLLTHPTWIFVVALTLRLATGAILLHGSHRTIDQAEAGLEAVGIAQSLASGHGFSNPWPGAGPTAWLTPIMPAILAADMLVFGLHSRATLIVFVVFNELCSALTIFPVFFAARRIAGGGTVSGDRGSDRIAALAAWLCVLDPLAALAAYEMIWYTSLSGLLAALLLWATLALRDSKKPVVWTGYGLLWGAQLMTHPSFLLLMPVALLWLVWDLKRLKLATLACIIAILCCVPWTIRNFVVFHHLVALRSNFGFELWRSNQDGPPLHPNSDAVEQVAFSSLGEYAYVQGKQREAFLWIGTHPGRFMRLTAGRVIHFWFGPPYRMSRFAHGGPWVFDLTFLYICSVLVMNVAGLITIWRKRCEYFWLLASFPAIFPLLYYISRSGHMYRVPIHPILAIIAAFAATGWLPGLPRSFHDTASTLRAGQAPVCSTNGGRSRFRFAGPLRQFIFCAFAISGPKAFVSALRSRS